MTNDFPMNAFNTKAIHAGAAPDPTTGARQVPIYQTTSYVFENTEHAANLFALKDVGNIYSRLTNPTVGALQNRIASLEGGAGAVCTSSGHAAQMLAFFAIMSAGDNFVAANKLYGGSINQFSRSFKQFDWQVRFVDTDNVADVEANIDEKTKAIYVESLANPGGVITDIEAMAAIAKRHGIPLIVDNTMATPYLCNPFEFGADIIVHSTTKFISGNGTSVGGVVVDSGKFDWKQSDKFAPMTQPDPGYNGLVFADLGEMALTFYGIANGLRDLGACLSPFNAFLTLNGIETLALRMERHVANAQQVAEWLENHPAVSWVSYAGLSSSQYNERATKYLPNGAGSVFTFGLKGGYDAGTALVNNTGLFSHVANIGDTRSLIIHPASTTHSQLSDAGKVTAGAAPDTIRVSIGLEGVDDIIADLDQALGQATGKLAA